MVTGATVLIAISVARECGILAEGGMAIVRSDFRSKSMEQNKEIIPRIRVMTRSMPLNRRTLLTIIKEEFDEVVVVIGDEQSLK